MNNLEIRNDEVNVEKIMEQIRERIRLKKEKGVYSTQDLEELSIKELKIPHLNHAQHTNLPDLRIFTQKLSLNFNAAEGMPISSHRRYLGKLIVLAKKITRRLLNPIIKLSLMRQMEFNSNLVHFANSLLSHLESIIEKVNILHNDLMEIKQDTTVSKGRLALILEELRRKYNLKEDQIKSLYEHGIHMGDQSYFRFEKRFRGSSEDIRDRQEMYLSYLKGVSDVVDVGCGRGEFLELLKSKGIPTIGIEINDDMVYTCRQKGLDVVQEDAIRYFRSMEDNSIGAIFSAQVLEHFTSEELIEFLRLSYQKLAPAGIFVGETINPQSLNIFADAFYLDVSHKKPIHPEGARFLFDMVGFKEIDIKYTSEVPEERRLKGLEINGPKTDFDKQMVQILNENISKLNKLLYGYQDYAIIARKTV